MALRVLPSGVKTYAVLWGRGKAHAIGRHPVMTLDGARSAAQLVLAAIAANGQPDSGKPARGALTFGRYMDEHYGPHVEATAKAGAATVANIKTQFGHLYARELTKVSRADFDGFKAARLKDGISPVTVNRDLDRLKAALSMAVEWGLLAANPLAKVKRIKRDIEDRIRYLAKGEETRLRKALEARETAAQKRRARGNAWRSARGRELLPAFLGYSDHLAPLTLIALNTGLRRGELTQLQWADVDLAGKRLTVRAGYAKSGKTRHIPLNSEALAVLKTLARAGAGKGALFAVSTLPKSWAALMTAAKIENFRFHDLRHTFASKLVMAGVDLNTVRELLGHSDIKMTLRYAHLAPEHKAAAVEVLVRR